MKRLTTLASALSVTAALLLMASVGRSEDAAPPAAKAVGTAVISGKVTDSTGKPAAGIKINLYAGEGAAKPQHAAKDPNKAKGNRPAPMSTTTTDDQGTYKFDALPAGPYTVGAMGKALGHGTAHTTLTDGQNATLDIQLQPGKKAAPKN